MCNGRIGKMLTHIFCFFFSTAEQNNSFTAERRPPNLNISYECLVYLASSWELEDVNAQFLSFVQHNKTVRLWYAGRCSVNLSMSAFALWTAMEGITKVSCLILFLVQHRCLWGCLLLHCIAQLPWAHYCELWLTCSNHGDPNQMWLVEKHCGACTIIFYNGAQTQYFSHACGWLFFQEKFLRAGELWKLPEGP